MGLLNLPTEILLLVFFHADQDCRKGLRLTNRQLSEIGRQSLFQTVCVSPTQESRGRLENILDRPDLVSYVTKVYLNTFDLQNPHKSVNEGDAKLPLRLLEYLKKLPRLQSVVLRFHPECPEGEDDDDAPQGDGFRSTVMKQGLVTLAAMPHLKELALRDMYNVNETDSESVENLNKILPRLRSLRLNITNVSRGMSGVSDSHRDRPQLFFSELPSFWLKPGLSKLEHLSLYSSLYVGFLSKCDFRGLHFPSLKTLALANHVFAHDSQLDWILSHKETLTELYLDDCGILFEAAVTVPERTYLPPEAFRPHPNLSDDEVYYSYSTRWADYFRAFKDNLLNLRHFRYGHAPNWWEDDTTPFESEGKIAIRFHGDSYMVFCDGFLPSEYMAHIVWMAPGGGFQSGQPLKISEDDRRALVELCGKVGVSVNLHYI
ncbi:hypothetical protein BDW62DRAFT_216256 [Aspergillus aurantiobrunneus]